METLIDILWTRTWWAFAGADDPIHAWVYRGINGVEGAFWLGFAALVLLRRARQPAEQRSGIEVAYALAFVAFGLTDFREAVALQSWLIWVKLVNLVLLLVLRHRVIHSLYPQSKLY